MILVKGNGDRRGVQLEGDLKELQAEIALACVNLYENVLELADEESAKAVIEMIHKAIDYGVKTLIEEGE